MRLINPEIRIETTNQCNATCTMCPREKMERLEGVMEMDLFQKIVREGKKLGAERIFLGGFGEPLMDPFLPERVKFVKEQALFCNFISNGSLWNEEQARRFIEAGLDEIRFSFYGQTKETYETIHRGLHYKTTRENIERLIALRMACATNQPTILVYFLVLAENEDYINAFRQEWEPLADFIEIWRPHNFGDGRSLRDIKGGTFKETCGRPKNGPLQFQYDGTLIPCCYDYDGKMILGDIRERSIPEILRDRPYQNLRRAHDVGDFSNHPYCDNCDQLLEHSNALVYTNRHTLPPETAVLLSNSNHFQLK